MVPGLLYSVFLPSPSRARVIAVAESIPRDSRANKAASRFREKRVRRAGGRHDPQRNLFPSRSGVATSPLMAKLQKRYVCQACGSVSHRWQGQCADCGEWNTSVEEAPATVTPFQAKHNSQGGGRAFQLVSLDAEISLPDR
ncbi:hypothetical protein OY671_011660, partial [Metschnikowia pulcherrima]